MMAVARWRSLSEALFGWCKIVSALPGALLFPSATIICTAWAPVTVGQGQLGRECILEVEVHQILPSVLEVVVALARVIVLRSDSRFCCCCRIRSFRILLAFLINHELLAIVALAADFASKVVGLGSVFFRTHWRGPDADRQRGGDLSSTHSRSGPD